MRLARGLDRALHGLLQHEQQRREQNQERNEPIEHRGRRHDQQHGADNAADQAGDRSSEYVDFGSPRQIVAVAPHAAERTGPDGHRARRVRDRRRQPDPHERGKRQQRAAAGDGVDGARDECCDENDEVRHGFAQEIRS